MRRIRTGERRAAGERPVIPKRVFWLTVGYGAGLGSSWYTARKVKAAARRYTPEGLTRPRG